MAAGAEEVCLSVAQILTSEKAGRTKNEQMIRKYADAISATWSKEIQKRGQFYSSHFMSFL